MDVRWLINRFSTMSVPEMGYRAKEAVKVAIGRRAAKNGGLNYSMPPVSGRRSGWHLDPGVKKSILSPPDGTALWNQVYAKAFLEHKFNFFSLKGDSVGDTINWHSDYKNNKTAPLKYSPDIDYRDFTKVGDIKYIWEINRHQHLIELAKAYYLTGDTEYKDEVKKQITGWICANPYVRGVNWRSSLELAIRLISWSWVWTFLGAGEDEFKTLWLKSIYKHCVFISRHFSRYSSANNHLIGEAAGLFIAGATWPFDGDSKRWMKKCFNILMGEADRQTYADGVNKEQAVSYHQFVLDFFMLAGILGRQKSIDFPASYWDRLEAMMEFIASIMDRSGNVPQIGDSDDGMAVILSYSKSFNPYQSLLATGAVLLKREDFAAKAGKFDEKSLWLLGSEGREKFDAMVKNARTGFCKKTFKESGYYVLGLNDGEKDEIKAVFDCGALGYLSIAAHGHSDALSFTLSVGGEEFLIDSGTYAYHTHRAWRGYFRGTSAHNTVRIDKEDQSVQGGEFMWVKKAEARLERWESDKMHDCVEASHNGYMRLEDPTAHSREICFDKETGIFLIKDKIKARRTHLIEQFFHFSTGCSVKDIDKNTWEVKNNGRTIYLETDRRFNSRLVCGSENPMLGWESKKLDTKHRTNTLVNSYRQHGNAEFITTISTKNR
ncbi:MAG: alginate lyase family protein [Candidatus Omnitrophica bacterium]|nr:alginate lyase family protein [Candidatus Omnitrophota bacterium]